MSFSFTEEKKKKTPLSLLLEWAHMWVGTLIFVMPLEYLLLALQFLLKRYLSTLIHSK